MPKYELIPLKNRAHLIRRRLSIVGLALTPGADVAVCERGRRLDGGALYRRHQIRPGGGGGAGAGGAQPDLYHFWSTYTACSHFGILIRVKL